MTTPTETEDSIIPEATAEPDPGIQQVVSSLAERVNQAETVVESEVRDAALDLMFEHVPRSFSASNRLSVAGRDELVAAINEQASAFKGRAEAVVGILNDLQLTIG